MNKGGSKGGDDKRQHKRGDGGHPSAKRHKKDVVLDHRGKKPRHKPRYAFARVW